MQNCYIYCRVSTEEQADKGYSLDAQEKLCRDFAVRSGFNVIGVFRDEGKSGKTLERPALQEMLSRCGDADSLVAVIVQETDRLARNTKDHLTIKSVLQKAKVNLISVAQPMLDDSPEGKMIDTILASVNQFQSDINGRKTKRGMQERFEQGWWPGLAPLGYINVKDKNNFDKNIIERDPDRWDLIKEVFMLFLSGRYSVEMINNILYDKGLCAKGGQKLSLSVIFNMLNNPFYAGLMRWDGREQIGKHVPMISMADHNKIANILKSHLLNGSRKRIHNFLLRGFVYCNICGHRYTAEKHRMKKSYYHCASKGVHSNQFQHIETSLLEDEIADQFKTIHFSDEFIDQLIQKLHKLYRQQKHDTRSEKDILINQQHAIEIKRDRAEEKLLNGILSDADFIRLRARFNAEILNIQKQIDDLDDQHNIDMDTLRIVLDFCKNVYKTYIKASATAKRHYLSFFWEKFLVEDKHIVKAVPTKLISDLLKERSVIIRDDWYPRLELIITLSNSVRLQDLRSRIEEINKLQTTSQSIS